MQSPLIFPQMPQTVGGQVGGLADPHTGQARQQQSGGEQVVAAPQFGLQAGIIFRRQGARQNLIGLWNIFAEQQAGPRWMGMIGQQVQQFA
jgi:hypothetical protein